MGLKKVAEVCSLAVIFLFIHLSSAVALYSYEGLPFCYRLLIFAMSITCLLVAACLFDIVRRHPADSHTWRTLLADYVDLILMVHLRGPALLAQLNRTFKDCSLHQEITLREIIRANETTAYGYEHGIRNITCREDLIRLHPITTYAQYGSYAERVVQGEANVMTSDPVVLLALTSGTTGKRKVFPITRKHYQMFSKMRPAGYKKHATFYYAHGLARRFEFRLFYPLQNSPTGIPMGGVGWEDSTTTISNIVPVSYERLEKEDETFYSQAVFALAEPELGFIDAFSSDVFLAFWQFMIFHHERLCNDIARGVIEPFADLDGDVLHDLNKYMRPNMKRAEEVRRAFKGPAVGLARRLWPRLRNVACAKTGSFAHSASILVDTYLKDFPMNYLTYWGTEGWYGDQLEDDSSSEVYTLIPYGAAFLEFIPAEDVLSAHPRIFFMDQLELGQSYEIVVTNFAGLYRYRMGDIIRIVGFVGNTPKYVISHRMGQVLNLVFEHTPECVLLAAIKDAENRLGDDVSVTQYTATESFHVSEIKGSPYKTPCYVLFLEVTKGGEFCVLTDKQKNQFEEALIHGHEAYADFRRQGSIGPVDVVQVEKGAFHDLRNILTVPCVQFKMPRVLRKPEGLALLWNKQI